MKKIAKSIILTLFALVMIVSLAACDDGSGDTNSTISSGEIKERDITVIYSDGLEARATELCQKLKTVHCTAEAKPFESSMEFEGDIVVLGYVDHKSINDITSLLNINDYVLNELNDCFYIGGRSDSDVINKALEKFYDRYINNRQYFVTKNNSYTYENAVTLDKAEVGGGKLSDYSIVYAPNPGEAISYKTIAEDIAALLKQKTGAELAVKSDAEAETDFEIVIGSSRTRERSKKYRGVKLEMTDYIWDVDGKGIVVTGGSSNAIYSGVLDLIARLESSEKTVFEGNEVVRKHTSIVKVACVGDSITQGDSAEVCYPAFLQQMLGYDYEVKNFGLSGYSTRKQDPYPYIGSAQYNNAVKYAADVVIYMLGTNDCQPTKSWNDDTKKTYKESANEIFKALTDANPNVQIFVVLPPSLFKNTVWQGWETWAEQVKTYAVPLNKELAEENGYEIVDAYTWSLTHQDVFKDGLHPKGDTYRDFASCIYNGIKGKIGAVR